MQEHKLLLRHIETTWPSMVPDHNAAFASYAGPTSTVRNTRQTGGTALVALVERKAKKKEEAEVSSILLV